MSARAITQRQALARSNALAAAAAARLSAHGLAPAGRLRSDGVSANAHLLRLPAPVSLRIRFAGRSANERGQRQLSEAFRLAFPRQLLKRLSEHVVRVRLDV